MTTQQSATDQNRTRRGPLKERGYAGRRARTGTLLVIPALVTLVAVLALPIVSSLLLSFQKASTSALGFGDFVGLDNYRQLVSDPVFWMAIRQTLYWIIVEVTVVVTASIGFAVLLNHPMGRPAVFRVILLIPWALAPVANAVLWKWIYNSSYGILNFALTSVGVLDEPRVWLGDPGLALNALVLAEIWKELPFITLLMLAGLQNVPPVLYRAAALDGATPWQKFRFVTLPQLRTTILICVVLQSIWALKSFDLIYVLTRGGPADSTVMLNYLAYRVSFQFGDLGVGAAVADILFIFMFLLALAYIRFLQPKNIAKVRT